MTAFLRPKRSPKWPKMIPPRGRAMKPTAKVAKAASVPTAGEASGKNSAPSTRADAVP